MSETESGRINKFLKAVENWLATVVQDVGEHKVKEMFHDCICLDPQSGKRIPTNNKIVKRIGPLIESNALKYVTSCLEEPLQANKTKAELLTALEEKYRDRKESWRPPHDPKEHLRSARIIAKQQLLAKLELLVFIEKEKIDKQKRQIVEKGINGKQSETPFVINELQKTLNSNAAISEKLNSKIERTHQSLMSLINIEKLL